MIQTDLAARPEHVDGIHDIHVVQGCLIPSFSTQVFAKTVEELLNMVRNHPAQAPAHVLPYLGMKFERISLRQLGEAIGGRDVIPRLETVVGIDVRVGGKLSLPKDRSQADASGEEQGDAIPVRLAILAQPAHEFIRGLSSLRGDAVVVFLEQTVDEYREFIDCEHDTPVVSGQGGEYLVALLLPVSPVDSRAEFHLNVRQAHGVDAVAQFTQYIDEPGLDAVPCDVRAPRLDRNFDNRVLRRVGGF